MWARRASILISDDDAALRETLCELFAHEHYDVRPVVDGQAALEAVLNKPVDLLLTDFHMPRLSGLELIERVRLVRPNLPAILMSGEVSPQLERAAARVTALRLFRKPPDRRELTGEVQRLLRLHRGGGDQLS
jgi:CheY-like chemotaxis protein